MRNKHLQILIERTQNGRYALSVYEPGSTVMIGHFGTLAHAKKAGKKILKATRKGYEDAPIMVLEPTTLDNIFHE